MKFTEWLKQEKKMPILRLRKKYLNNQEWAYVCNEYEEFCKNRNLKPVYD